MQDAEGRRQQAVILAGLGRAPLLLLALFVSPEAGAGVHNGERGMENAKRARNVLNGEIKVVAVCCQR